MPVKDHVKLSKKIIFYKENSKILKNKVHYARKNLFYDWLKSKNKVGGQNKIPRLSNDRKFFDELLKIN